MNWIQKIALWFVDEKPEDIKPYFEHSFLGSRAELTWWMYSDFIRLLFSLPKRICFLYKYQKDNYLREHQND